MTLERKVGLGAGLALIVGGVLLGSGPYEDRQRFERAGICPASAADRSGCITRSHAVVESRSSVTREDPDPPDPNWPPPQQPPPPPYQPPIYLVRPVVKQVRHHVLASTSTSYAVVLRTDDGHRHTLEVDGRLYQVATKGASVTVDSWHGRIRRIAIAGRTHDQWPYWHFVIAWMMAWAGIILILGWALATDRRVGGIAFGAWWGGFIAYLVTSAWEPAWYVVPLAVAGALLLVRGFFAGKDRRRYGR